MVLKDNIYKDFGWKVAETSAHNYIFKTVEKIFNEFMIPNKDFILDAGCGGGYIIDKLYNKGYKNIWGFDLSESGIKLAKDTYKLLEDRFTLHNCYEQNLSTVFPHTNYDVILSVEVIEHLYNPGIYIENIRHWLKDGGYLILTTPYHGYLKNLAISLTNKFDWHVNPLQDGGHIKFFSKKTLCQLLNENGFDIIKFYGCGRLPYLWKSMIFVARKK